MGDSISHAAVQVGPRSTLLGGVENDWEIVGTWGFGDSSQTVYKLGCGDDDREDALVVVAVGEENSSGKRTAEKRLVVLKACDCNRTWISVAMDIAS
jgi:hypothetical protein